jgi:hypothetical protein
VHVKSTGAQIAAEEKESKLLAARKIKIILKLGMQGVLLKL